jgi:HlyD family secretion protein
LKQDLFRKVALERLSSPEQLDQLIRVTTPRAWFNLLALGLILLAAVAWGIWGSIPDKVSGQGILINSGGVYNIVHSSAGQITDIRVRPGDKVKRGEVVARIDQLELVDQINQLKSRLKKMKDLREARSGSDIKELPPDLYQLASSIESARTNKALAGASYSQDLNEIQLGLDQAKVQADNQRTYINKIELLYEQNAISENDLINAKKDLTIYELNVRNNTTALSALENYYREEINKAQKELQLLESQLEAQIFQTEADINKIQNDLDTKSAVISQMEGRVLELNVNNGDMVQPGMQLFSLERQGGNVKMEVVMYVPAEVGKKIVPGMEAQLSPTTVKKEEYGYMLGRVISVSEYPTTIRSMALTLGSEELAAQLAGQSAPLLINIDLITDEKTLSGYKWSSQSGPPLKINSGTLCTGSITIREQRPVQMVIPSLKKALL